MTPFVIIYGVSAFLFNHAGVATMETPLAVVAAPVIDPSELSVRVSEALGIFAKPAQAELEGAFGFEFVHDSKRHRMTLPLGDRAPTVRRLADNASHTERLAPALLAPMHDAALEAARRTLVAAGFALTELRRVTAPTLHFAAGDDTVAVSLDRSQATRRTAPTFDIGRLLMRLHTAHGYGDHWARFAWAIVVDLMAASMLLWVGSGAVMWWQRRSHRRSGAFVLIGGIAVAITVAIALSFQFDR